jgi:TolA-binding protein
MYKKNHYIVFVFIGLMFFLSSDASADIEQAKQDIISLIKERSYAQARAQTQKLIEDYSTASALPDALYLIARQYEWSERLKDAKNTYQQMLKNFPDENWAVKANLGVARTDVLYLIVSKNSQAEEAFNKLVADFNDHPDFQDTLYWVARNYEFAGKNERAKSVYQRMIQNNSVDSTSSPQDRLWWTDKAKLGFARANILALIKSRNYSQAREAFDKLVAEDFSNHEDWPATLYWIAEGYKWSDRYKDAKDFYQKIIQDCPNSPYASKAKLCIPMLNVKSRIGSYNLIEAKTSFDKLVADFNSNPYLPEALWQIAEKYRWSQNFEEEKDIYQKILEKYPNNPYADKAKLGFARANIMSLIMSQDYDEAEDAFDKLIVNFENHPDLQDTIYWIARCYGWTSRYEDERRIYQVLIQKYPSSSYAGKAEVGDSKANVASLIVMEDYNKAEAAIGKLIADFNNHPDLPSAIFAVGTKYFEKALQYKNDGNDVEAEEYFRKAANLWGKIITEFSSSDKYTPQAYYYSAFCYSQEWDEYGKAIEYYQKLLDNWPDFDYRRCSYACLGIAFCYEKLEKEGKIPRPEAAEKIRWACNKLLTDYPNAEPSTIQNAQKILKQYQVGEQ